MITFSVCPHDTKKALSKWIELASKLSEIMGQEVKFEHLYSHEEELRRIAEGKFFDIYYASPMVVPELNRLGYKAVGRIKGQVDSFFLVYREIPKEGEIVVAVPFLRPIGLTIMNLDIERVRIVLAHSHIKVVETVKNGEAHAGVVYNETWEQIPEDEKRGLEIFEKHVFQSSHLFMVKEELEHTVGKALQTIEDIERVSEDDLNKILNLFQEYDKFSKLWSMANIARALQDASNVGILIYGERVLFANRALLEMIGYEDKELIGKRIEDAIDLFIHADYRVLTKSVARRSVAGERFPYVYRELPIVRKDNRLIYTLTSSETIIYKGNYAGIVFFVDITRMKRFETIYSLLTEINQIALETRSEKDLLRSACKTLVEKGKLKFAWVGVPDGDYIKPIYYYGYEDGYLSEIVISTRENLPEGKGPTATAFRENRIIVNTNTLEMDFMEPCREKMLKRGYLSSCAIPLSKGERVEYVLNLYAGEPYYFEREVEDLLFRIKENLQSTFEKIEKINRETIISKAIENSKSWVMICDKSGKITYVNAMVQEISGYSEEELLGKSPSVFKSGYHTADFFKSLWNNLLAGEEFHGIFVNRKKNGEIFYLEQSIYPVRLPDGGLNYISIGKDITKEVQLSSEVERLALYDVVTGLLNMESFRSKAETLLEQDNMYALALIDIFGLAIVNKNYGVDVGDKVLYEVGRRISKLFPNNGLVARIAGDEFGLLLGPLKDEKEVFILENTIKEAFEEPLLLGEHSITISANAGISVSPKDGKDFKTLYERASLALSQAKSEGEGEMRFYRSELEKKAEETNVAIQLVSRALQENLFLFYYQPYFTSRGLRLRGFEALVRIKDRDGKIYTPAYFIDYLENSRFLRDFENWAIDEAVRKSQEFGVPISLNISAKSFKDRQLVEKLMEVPTGIYIIVEITERVFMEYSSALNYLQDIKRNTKIKIALDDFGTGFSSFVYLLNFPVDLLKIDMSFVRAMVQDSRTRSAVRNIITLATDLGIDTLAEGVETEEQLRMLQDMGCTYVQGYLLGKPMPETDIKKLISML